MCVFVGVLEVCVLKYLGKISKQKLKWKGKGCGAVWRQAAVLVHGYLQQLPGGGA